MRVGILETAQADSFQPALCARATGRFRHAQDFESVRDVVEGFTPRQQPIGLKDCRQTSAEISEIRIGFLIVDGETAARRPLHSRTIWSVLDLPHPVLPTTETSSPV